MTGVLAIVAMSVVGIDVGWQPLPGGGFEYIIQIEPEMLETMKGGQDIASQLPPALRGVRNYRITVGNGPLPHEGEPPPALPANPPAAAPRSAIRPGDVAATSSGPSGGQALPGPGEVALPPPPADSLPTAPPAAVVPAEPTPPATDLSATAPSDTTPTPSLPWEPDPTQRTAGYQVPNVPSIHAEGKTPEPEKGRMAFPGAGLSRMSQGDPLPPPPADVPVDPHAEPAAAAHADPRADKGSEKKGAEKSDKGADAPDEASKGKSTVDSAADAAADATKVVGEAKPWLPLVGSVLALFGSLGTNVYLAWNTLALRSRYRTLLSQHSAD